MLAIIGLGFLLVGFTGLLLHRSLLRLAVSSYFCTLGICAILLSSPDLKLLNLAKTSETSIQKSGQILGFLVVLFGALVACVFMGMALRAFHLSGKEDASILDKLRH